MSWGNSAHGTPEGVAQKVNNDSNVPQSIKDVANDLATKLEGKDVIILFESNGHFDFTGAAPYGPTGYATVTVKYGPAAKKKEE